MRYPKAVPAAPSIRGIGFIQTFGAETQLAGLASFLAVLTKWGKAIRAIPVKTFGRSTLPATFTASSLRNLGDRLTVLLHVCGTVSVATLRHVLLKAFSTKLLAFPEDAQGTDAAGGQMVVHSQAADSLGWR